MGTIVENINHGWTYVQEMCFYSHTGQSLQSIFSHLNSVIKLNWNGKPNMKIRLILILKMALR